jgi:hypothetical protein
MGVPLKGDLKIADAQSGNTDEPTLDLPPNGGAISLNTLTYRHLQMQADY